MNLAEQINQDLISAMKDGQSERVAVLRLLKNALKNEEIKVGHELSIDESIAVLKREAKQRRQSIEAFESGGRDDLVANEKAELAAIEAYLPKQMDESELKDLVKQVITELGVTDKTGTGRVIAEVMKRSGGAADGGMVAGLVQRSLAG